MSMTHDGQFGPQDAYIGGIIGQECMKAITGKFMPIKQVMYADCVEVLPQEIFSAKFLNDKSKKESDKKEDNKVEESSDEMIEESKPEEKKL